MKQNAPLGQRVRTLVIGRARSPHDPHIFHRLSLIAFFAWIGLGGDGLSSSCYGPEEAFRTLGEHYHLAIVVGLASAITIFVISASYSQIIELFPSGGGGYLVASKLLSPSLGMVSGCALLLDYVLTITISIASGVDALFSFLPEGWHAWKMETAILGIFLLTIVNLRGVKESVIPLVPIFLAFVVTHLVGISYALLKHVTDFPAVATAIASDVQRTHQALGVGGILILIMRAYSMGAGTFTGIEAVSNGIPVLRDPKVQTAKHTMRYMAVSLAFVVMGLMLAYILFRVEPVEGKTLNAVLFETLTAAWGDAGRGFVWVTLVSEATLLFVAAQTGFLDGPRVLANMALDRWVPTKFATLSDRLVTQNGILLMGGAALVTMLLSGASVRFLVVLYSINVFITFVLSQSGMVRHWWLVRSEDPKWCKRILINGVGLALTGFILVSVILLKFYEGGWITLAITTLFILAATAIRRHYNNTFKLLKRLDNLVAATESDVSEEIPAPRKSGRASPREPDPNARTAVLLVNGFSGLGLHTLLSVVRLFPEVFENYVFVSVGMIDAGMFKGTAALKHLREKAKEDVERYVAFMHSQGSHAEAISSVGIDVVDEVEAIAKGILKKYPHAVFFGGQLVFAKETFLTRWLHNYTAFAIQRRFYRDGIPVIILPIRV